MYCEWSLKDGAGFFRGTPSKLHWDWPGLLSSHFASVFMEPASESSSCSGESVYLNFMFL